MKTREKRQTTTSLPQKMNPEQSMMDALTDEQLEKIFNDEKKTVRNKKNKK